ARQLLPPAAVQELEAAYVFLRNLEHRLQYLEDLQTQDLPANETAQTRIALAMGQGDWPALLAELERHRVIVQRHFDEVFSDPGEEETPAAGVADLWLGAMTQDDTAARLQALGYAHGAETLQRLQALREGRRYRQLPELSRQRFDELMPMLIDTAAAEANADAVLLDVSDLLEAICRRASYLALLAEYPAALGLVIKFAAASPWLIQYLARHPILLDELLDTRTLYAEPDFEAMRAELQQRLCELDGDVELQMDAMRHFKHAATFRFAAQDIAGELPLRRLSDYLSALADLVLQLTLETVWPGLRG